jgi:hypothetical protein
MKIARLSRRLVLRSFAFEGGKFTETAMIRKTLSLMTFTLSACAVANAEPVTTRVATHDVLQVVRMQATSADADLELMTAFNLCTDSIKHAPGSVTRDACVRALDVTRDSAIRLSSEAVLVGTLNRAALNQNVAAAYSNAALASWQVGDIKAAGNFMRHAIALAPSASFVRANAPRLAGISADLNSLASN